MCLCMSVCLRVNHNDVIWLGVQVDHVLPSVRHKIPRLNEDERRNVVNGIEN